MSTNPEDAHSVSSNDEITSTIANNETLTRIFIADVTSRVTKAILEREDRRQRNLSIIFTILGLILAAGAFTSVQIFVKNTVTEALKGEEDSINLFVENNVKEQLDESIGEVRDEIQFQENYQQLTYLAFSLRFKNSFSNEERDLVMLLLKDFAGRPELKNRDDFPVILDKILDSFFSAGLDHYIDEIFSFYETEIFRSTSMSQTVCMHYGQRLIAAEVLQTDDVAGLREKFTKIAENAEKIRYAEYCMPFQLVYEYTRDSNDTNKFIDNLLAQVEFFSPEEQSVVIARLFKYRLSGYYQKEPDYQSTVITPKFDEFFLAYNDRLSGMASRQDVTTGILKIIGESSVYEYKRALKTWLEGQPTSVITPTAEDYSSGSIGQDSTFRIINASEQTICYAYISPTESDSWGEDWLGTDQLSPGEGYSFDLISGTYDLRLQDCDRHVLLEETEIIVDGLYELEFTISEENL